MRLSFALAWLLFCCATFAQQEQTLHEVQVTAHRRLKDTGLQQTVLDTAILHQNVAQSMADILTHNSTLFVKSYGRATESTVEFRGTSPSHTQVLWNGMKINSPMLGTFDFSTIPSYFVDHAILLHGASSLTRTGGGLGGAVDMMTHPVYGQGHTLHNIQGAGSFRTFDQFLRYSYGNERWSTSTRAVYSTSENNFRYTNYDKIGHPTERNRSGYFDDIHLMHDTYHRDGKGNRFGLAAWYTHSLRGLPFLSVDYKDNSDFTNEHREDGLRTTISWDRMLNHWNVGVHSGYSWQYIRYDYFTTRQAVNTDITHSRSRSQQAYIQANADWMPTAQWLVTANLATYYNHVRSEDKSPFHIGDNYNRGRAEYNLSLSARWRPIRQLSLSAILREECYARDFVPVIPAFFIEYQANSQRIAAKGQRIIFKASVARNYRYPSMDDLYYKPGGNPNLQPERGFTYDGGVEYNLKKKSYSLNVNASAFDSHISDWIIWTPNAKGYWQPSNLKRVHSNGTEIMASAEVRMKHQWSLGLNANYAFTPSINKSERTDGNDTSYGKQLVYVPRHSANVSGRLSWRTWALRYQWMCYSERFTTTSNEVSLITGRLLPYYMNNVSLEKQFLWRRLPTKIKAVVNNLLGSEYITVLSRPMPGRNFEIFVEIKPQWKRK